MKKFVLTLMVTTLCLAFADNASAQLFRRNSVAPVPYVYPQYTIVQNVAPTPAPDRPVVPAGYVVLEENHPAKYLYKLTTTNPEQGIELLRLAANYVQLNQKNNFTVESISSKDGKIATVRFAGDTKGSVGTIHNIRLRNQTSSGGESALAIEALAPVCPSDER